MKKELSILMKKLIKLFLFLILTLIVMAISTKTLYTSLGYYNAIRNMIVIIWKVVLIMVIMLALFLIIMHKIIKECIKKDGSE